MRIAGLTGIILVVAGCDGGGNNAVDQPDLPTQLNFEQLLDLGSTIEAFEETLPTNEYGFTLMTTGADGMHLGTVRYAGVGNYVEFDPEAGNFGITYVAIGQFDAEVDFSSGDATGEMHNFYEVSNLDDYIGFQSGINENATFDAENSVAIEGTLDWVATIGVSPFGDELGNVYDESGNLLTRLTGTLTKQDGSFASIDAPVFTRFFGADAEVMDGFNLSLGFDAAGDEISVDYDIGFQARRDPD